MSARQITLQYFSILREQTGQREESYETTSNTISELYSELKIKYAFKLDESDLKVALNEEFVDFNTPFHSGDSIVFIPPVAGG